jgi:hypothetical protein
VGFRAAAWIEGSAVLRADCLPTSDAAVAVVDAASTPIPVDAKARTAM